MRRVKIWSGQRKKLFQGQVGDVAGEKLRQDEGKMVQDIGGELSVDQKEMLMSQTHLL